MHTAPHFLSTVIFLQYIQWFGTCIKGIDVYHVTIASVMPRRTVWHCLITLKKRVGLGGTINSALVDPNYRTKNRAAAFAWLYWKRQGLFSCHNFLLLPKSVPYLIHVNQKKKKYEKRCYGPTSLLSWCVRLALWRLPLPCSTAIHTNHLLFLTVNA